MRATSKNIKRESNYKIIILGIITIIALTLYGVANPSKQTKPVELLDLSCRHGLKCGY